jgi:transcription elongation factor Elf1
MLTESSFQWTCPNCDHDQTETVTIDGPVMSLICGNCAKDFAASDLPRDIRKAWSAAIEDVIPQGA